MQPATCGVGLQDTCAGARRLQTLPVISNRVLVRCCMVIAIVLSCSALQAAGETPAGGPPAKSRGRVLVFRGAMNIFSLGLDDMARQLRRDGYDVYIAPPTWGVAPGLQLQRKYLSRDDRRPVILVGHSMGVRTCLGVAKWLQANDVPVELLLALDAHPNARVPSNVQRCVNLYVTNPLRIFHGMPMTAEDPHTPILNLDITRLKRPGWARSVDHFNIDNSLWIRQIALNEIAAASQQQSAIAPPASPQLPTPSGLAKPALMLPVFASSAARHVQSQAVESEAPRTKLAGVILASNGGGNRADSRAASSVNTSGKDPAESAAIRHTRLLAPVVSQAAPETGAPGPPVSGDALRSASAQPGRQVPPVITVEHHDGRRLLPRSMMQIDSVLLRSLQNVSAPGARRPQRSHFRPTAR